MAMLKMTMNNQVLEMSMDGKVLLTCSMQEAANLAVWILQLSGMEQFKVRANYTGPVHVDVEILATGLPSTLIQVPPGVKLH